MNMLHTISLLSWIAMWLAFHFRDPVGYVIALVGLAAAAAIALEPGEPAADNESRKHDESAPEQATGSLPGSVGRAEGKAGRAQNDDLPRAA